METHKQISYLQFRSNALSGLTLFKDKDRPKFKSSEDQEDWAKSEYLKHYPKVKK